MLCRYSPTKVKFNERKIQQIAAGLYHAIAVTDLGCTYTWGRNNYGQLGLGHFDDRMTPQVVSELSGHCTVGVAAADASLAQTRDGRIFIWGGKDGNSKPTLVPLNDSSSSSSSSSSKVLQVALGKDLYVLQEGNRLLIQPLEGLAAASSQSSAAAAGEAAAPAAAAAAAAAAAVVVDAAHVTQISAAPHFLMGVAPGDSYTEQEQQQQQQHPQQQQQHPQQQQQEFEQHQYQQHQRRLQQQRYQQQQHGQQDMEEAAAAAAAAAGSSKVLSFSDVVQSLSEERQQQHLNATAGITHAPLLQQQQQQLLLLQQVLRVEDQLGMEQQEDQEDAA
ncbi:regulator of chromosome condensation domain-containing protein, putative [Eimeria maxima]|uniref:Regulator of chromosome condensation domain-containing protein, putative n=1 Tax=Eimeria maxima TaxID=5804 RepID=U6M0I6_EIMMA|nr:regulator of chromosome condensation domain-containing protein, putative [Eimeria maxima]CDJ57737.1 regulator of chromosome condensation domain-containing protein, putative [Eimeria maxima]